MEQIFRNADVVAAHYFRSLKTSWEIFPKKVDRCTIKTIIYF